MNTTKIYDALQGKNIIFVEAEDCFVANINDNLTIKVYVDGFKVCKGRLVLGSQEDHRMFEWMKDQFSRQMLKDLF